LCFKRLAAPICPGRPIALGDWLRSGRFGKPSREPARRLTHMDDLEPLRRRLAELIDEHRDLDDVIARVLDTAPFDQIRVQRLKKRKLQLKDMIAKLQSQLLPDITA
jgi:hypothetical protein